MMPNNFLAADDEECRCHTHLKKRNVVFFFKRFFILEFSTSSSSSQSRRRLTRCVAVFAITLVHCKYKVREKTFANVGVKFIASPIFGAGGRVILLRAPVETEVASVDIILSRSLANQFEVGKFFLSAIPQHNDFFASSLLSRAVRSCK
jgi:hypothetical protein